MSRLEQYQFGVSEGIDDLPPPIMNTSTSHASSNPPYPSATSHNRRFLLTELSHRPLSQSFHERVIS